LDRFRHPVCRLLAGTTAGISINYNYVYATDWREVHGDDRTQSISPSDPSKLCGPGEIIGNYADCGWNVIVHAMRLNDLPT
jgi:hypothetical protein